MDEGHSSQIRERKARNFCRITKPVGCDVLFLGGTAPFKWSSNFFQKSIWNVCLPHSMADKNDDRRFVVNFLGNLSKGGVAAL